MIKQEHSARIPVSLGAVLISIGVVYGDIGNLFQTARGSRAEG